LPRILILCTGNSCRSQMAEGFLKAWDPTLEVYSAGTAPSDEVHPFAVRVMREVGVDISSGTAKDVELFLDHTFDFVITVCDHAREACPHFSGGVKERLHFGFEDPAEAVGTEEDVLAVFRRVRDEIRRTFWQFYVAKISGRKSGPS